MKSEKNILIAFILNLLFSIFEFIGGAITNSVAILSDAIHDLGDCLSIFISFVLERISKKKPDDIYTYGYVRYSIIGSVITTSILIVGSILVIINAVKRLFFPIPINYNGMIILAIVGIIVNLLASYYTKDGDSLNQKSVNLHMLEDVLNWAIVLVGAIIMRFTDIKIIDSLLSIGVAIFILINALKNLKNVVDIFLEKIPDGISISDLKKHLLAIKGIKDIHHIHIWTIDGVNNYATMHIVVNKLSKKLKETVKQELSEHGVFHTTIEYELTGEECLEKDCKPPKMGSIKHHHH
ncbi:MAG: cation transporter [Bacilli bacterium]|nr:cation transporter [Bacilli bacterium]